jgi:hypothetical protein
MAQYDDRAHYTEAVMHKPPDDRVKEIAREMDRLAAFAGDGKMFRMQVAGVLYAARCCGYVLTQRSGPTGSKLTVYEERSREANADNEADAETRLR